MIEKLVNFGIAYLTVSIVFGIITFILAVIIIIKVLKDRWW